MHDGNDLQFGPQLPQAAAQVLRQVLFVVGDDCSHFGNSSMAVTPPPTLLSSIIRPVLPNSVATRARTFDNPVPPASSPSSPTPVSLTSMRKTLPLTIARITISPPPILGSMP